MHYLIRITVAIVTFGLGAGLAGLAGVLVKSPTAFFSPGFTARTRHGCAKKSVKPVEMENRVLDARWVFVERDLIWKAEPRRDADGDASFESASADIAIFYPSGEFALVTCRLLRFRGDSAAIWIKDQGRYGYFVYRGNWNRVSRDTVVTNSELAVRRSTSRESGEPSVTSWKVGSGDLGEQSILRSGAKSFIHLENLTSLSMLDEIVRPPLVY